MARGQGDAGCGKGSCDPLPMLVSKDCFPADWLVDPGNGLVVDLAIGIRPGPHGVFHKSGQ